MAEAMVAGILKKRMVAPTNICVSDISSERLAYFCSKYGVATATDNAIAVQDADRVVLAVKPQVFRLIWPQLSASLSPDALVISVMAGIPSGRIAEDRPLRVVRVMPNTPALVGAGATGIAPGTFATDEDVQAVVLLMQSVGVVAVVTEAALDAVTALSGSGPAYVLYLLEGMLAAAEQMGLPLEEARELALATVSGTAELMHTTGEAPDALRRKVTSPGGTTAAALEVLDAHGVKDALMAAMLAAQARSKELANG